MADKRLLDRKRDEYTADGVVLAGEVLAALREIRIRWVKNGFSRNEIAIVINETASAAT